MSLTRIGDSSCTMARVDIEGTSGDDRAATRRAFDAMIAVHEVEVADVHDRIPLSLRTERLADQIKLFEYAGYRVESSTQVQAVLVRPHRRILSKVLGAGKTAHRVTITIDREGAVRLS